MERPVDPFLLLVPVALLAVAGVVRAARESTVSEYDPADRSDYDEATRRFL
jgi:hypothetical protein